MLTDGNDVFDVTQQLTDDEYEIRLDVETINKKGGIAQIIEYKDCQDIIAADGTVTFSFQAKVSATTKLDNIKCAIVAWSGTADTVTSDIISAWGVEGTNPTLIANATYENTPANLSVTTSYATYSVSAAIDTASTKNIIVMIWSDVTDTTAGDFIHIKRCQLELGTSATPFEFRPFQQELALCQRYGYGAFRASGFNGPLGPGVAYSTSATVQFIQFPVPLRTIAALSPAPTAGDFIITDGTTSYDVATIAASSYATTEFQRLDITTSGAPPLTQYRPYFLAFDGAADRRIFFDAEL
jgi:hypothetical protein